MEQSKQEVLDQINKMIQDQNGEIFIGMVNHSYGPLRGLNFIIQTKNAEDVVEYLDSQRINMEAEDQMEMVKKLREKRPKNLIEVIFKIWMETMLSTQAMILPIEMAQQAENSPPRVLTFNDGESEILKSLELTSNLQSRDPMFFRTGII
jgi:hypothetical protein